MNRFKKNLALGETEGSEKFYSLRDIKFSVGSHITGSDVEEISLALCLDALEDSGKKYFNENFSIQNSDHELISKLLTYFFRDAEKAKQYNLNLNKGILLSGPIGCGKTSLMWLLRHFLPAPHRHVMKPCRDVSFDFIKEGYEVLHRYSRKSFYDRSGDPLIYCFDDLGTENSLKYYGNECNVMAEIILSRYDLFISRKQLTHITTNLNSSEIEKIYGNRVRSRMREMFNLIAFDKSSTDKRQ